MGTTQKCPYCGAGWAGTKVSASHLKSCAKKNQAGLNPVKIAPVDFNAGSGVEIGTNSLPGNQQKIYEVYATLVPKSEPGTVDPVQAHREALRQSDETQRRVDRLKDEFNEMKERKAPQSMLESMLESIREQERKLSECYEQENRAAAALRDFEQAEWEKRVKGLDSRGLLKEYRHLDEDRAKLESERRPDGAKLKQIYDRLRTVNALLG